MNINLDKLDMDSVDGCLVLKGPGDLDFEYGYEYLGDSADLFLCPQTEQSVIGLYEAICRNAQDWRAILLQETNQLVLTGVLMQQLANVCGMSLIKTSFDSRTQYK